MSRTQCSIALAAALVSWAGAGSASAQDAQSQPAVQQAAASVPDAASQRDEVDTQLHAAPTVRLFGAPTEIWSPVDPPYTGTAYRTFDGQAETSADAISEQVAPGAE